MIYVEHKRSSEKNLRKKYPNCIIADVTSKAKDDLIKLSPFYPHGNIPVPYSNGITSKSVEGIWQGLKVFKNHGIDISSFENDKMRNIKRTVRKYGIPKGHQKGTSNQELLDYVRARILIYLPSFRWMLENKVPSIINRLRKAAENKDIILLDYTTNGDIFDVSKPLSHAYLIKLYAEGKYPNSDELMLKLSSKQKTVEHNLFTQPKLTNTKKIEVDLIAQISKFIGNEVKTFKQIKEGLNVTQHHSKVIARMKKSNKFEVIENSKPAKYKNK